jgi:signal transduction histidine kinase
LTKTIAPFRDTHELAYQIYHAVGNYPLALAHLEAFKRLDDDGRSLAASANLALMSTRFDFATQKLEIERLKTEQIRREATLKESRAATQRVLLLSLISAAVLVIVWISWRHRLLRRHRDVITRANAELTRILAERDQEIARRIETETHLRMAMEAAEQANRAKTQFLANMSHELRTPLNAIIGFSEIIASGIVPQSRAQEYSVDINASGRKLLVILNDILDTARLDAGAVSLSEEEVALGKVIDQALAKARKDSDLKGKDVRVTGDKSLRVRGDAQRMVQVVEKLVSNAAKFTAPDGNIAIGLKTAEDGGVDITVSDDGIGIPAEQINHIMDRFGQIESPYVRSHGGIGLGLPIVKSLIALHGGTLHIESEVEKGTLVRVHLPAERRLPNLQDDTDRTAAA